MKQQESLSDRFFRALLRILPIDFRTEFETEMQDVFREQRDEIKNTKGFSGLCRIWWSTIVDIFRMAPREHWSVLSMDAKYALRMMRRNPAFTAAAVFILGLGIGVNTAIFSVVNSVLLKPLPYIDGDRLIILRQPETKLGTDDALFSVNEIRDFREQTRTLEKVVEYHNMTFTLFGKGAAYRVRTAVVSADFFQVFGVRPLLGRTFIATDDQAGAEPVMVLSYEFWQQVEGGDPNIVGRKYEMNDRVHTVIGVLPAIPQYPDENDVFMPTSSCPMRSNPEMMAPRNARMMNVFGRLKQNATLPQAQAELAQISARFTKQYAEAYPQNAGHRVQASLLQTDLTERARPLLLILWVASAVVLLIACANVANLIMARMATREQELLVRTAVGAGNGRLLRQLLTESLFLAILAAIFGLFFTAGSLELMKNFASQITPRAREIVIDRSVMLFAIACASITTLFFGSVAAIYSRQDIASGLKESGRTGTESGSNFVRKFFITAQVAFSCVLLIGAGLMVRSFVRLIKVDPGFVPQRVLSARLNLNGDPFRTPEQRSVLADRIVTRLLRIPGVDSAAVSSSFPLDDENLNQGRPARFRVEGDPAPESECPPVSSVRAATIDYFKTLGIPIKTGRTFLATDDADAPQVVVLNQRLAERRWGKVNPVGKRITFDNGQTWMTIVGVVGNVKEFGLDREIPYQVYAPLQQAAFIGSALVRTSLEAKFMADAVRRALYEVEPRMAVPLVQTLEQARAKSISSPRTLASLFALFGILAMIIAVAGVGAMMSLWVKQRTRETGIRMALGASPGKILSSVMMQGILLVAIGLAAGLMISIAATQFLKSLLFQVSPHDLATYVLVSFVLLIGAILACYAPARRASKTPPVTALNT